MAKLFSSLHILKILEIHGFILISQKGSHIKMRKDGNPTLTVIVPAGRKEIPHGTMRSMLRQSQLILGILSKLINLDCSISPLRHNL